MGFSIADCQLPIVDWQKDLQVERFGNCEFGNRKSAIQKGSKP